MIPEVVNLTRAEYLGGYRLRLTFDDSKTNEVDFSGFLTTSVHPDIRKWLDEKAFRSYRLEFGELVWGDYDLCFPVADLYSGSIEHGASLETAV